MIHFGSVFFLFREEPMLWLDKTPNCAGCVGIGHYCYDDDDAWADTEIQCADNELAHLLLNIVAENWTAVARSVLDCWV
jgi:hypothetical protein